MAVIVQAILILVASAIVTIVVAVKDEPIAFMDFTGIAGTVMTVLLPVMGILAITSEWSQRTNMATFTLEPRRQRVVAAKVVAAVAAALASVALAVVIGYGASAAAARSASTSTGPSTVGCSSGSRCSRCSGCSPDSPSARSCSARPAAIVCFFAYFTLVPAVLAVAAEGIDWFADIRPWIDFADAQVPLSEDGFGAVHWPQFLVSGAIWFALPLAAGVSRMLRAEVKCSAGAGAGVGHHSTGSLRSASSKFSRRESA